jgi:hypothetical protein
MIKHIQSNIISMVENFLGIVADNNRTTLVNIMAPDGKGGKLVIEITKTH